MVSILSLARLYFLGNIRRQVHLITLVLCFLMAMEPAYVNTFSLGVGGLDRVAKDVGLTLIGFYGIAMALFLGSTAVPGDRDAKTIYPILARPVPRIYYLAAQLLSVSVMISLSLFGLALVFGGALSRIVGGFDPGILAVTLLYTIESMVLAAACICFSTFSSPPLAGVLGLFVYIVGGLSNTFVRFFIVQDRSAQGTAFVVRVIKSILPSFQVFHIKAAVVHVLVVPPGYVPIAVVYGIGWMFLFLFLGSLMFQRKDL